ncbi:MULTISPECIES: nuclear transport factor 2 family protein [unclassified Micromonospora]|uniref:nuclear transport factor 2 family protein n=1 Tax=unclassified Micromonospora TaxID=2617518 RepID=UPI003322F5F2
MVMSEEALTRVRRYYELVDKGDVTGMVALFTPDAVYDRPGYDTFKGRAALDDFYRADRVIADGRHTLRATICDGTTVAVQGDFEGVLKSGDHVRLRFADFFEIAPDGLFSRRDTYFFAPMV